MTLAYEIEYTKGFVIFWGIGFAFALYSNGLLSVAFVALALLTLIHHEHAHIEACNRFGVLVKRVEFNWLGGLVNMEPNNPHESRDILFAGIHNTASYALLFNGLVAAIYYIKPIGLNFANNPYLELLASCAMFTGMFVIVNVLPVSYKSKKYGLIATDGWGAIKMHRLIPVYAELWNDGAKVALDQFTLSVGNPTSIKGDLK